MDSRSIARRLFEEFVKTDKVWREIESTGIELPQDLRPDFVDLICDVLGVPKDNTLELITGEMSRGEEEMPDNLFCRDGLIELCIDVQSEEQIDGCIKKIVDELKEYEQEQAEKEKNKWNPEENNE